MQPHVRRLKQPRAFTLIELLVVIVILGTLMAVALPTFLRQQSKAQDSRTQQYLVTAYRAIRTSTPDNGNVFPSSTSMVSWITQSEPELTAQSGNCTSGVATAPADAVLVDPSSTTNSLQLCARSQSGNVWKLTSTATGAPSLLDGTLIPLTVSGNEITDATRAAGVQGDGLSNDSSTGVWETSTNVATNGGFETNTAGWQNNQVFGALAGTTFSRDTTTSKFGSASLKVTTDGTGATQGVFVELDSPPYNMSGQMWTFSVWARGTGTLQLGVTGEVGTPKSAPFTLTSTWTRYVFTQAMAQSGNHNFFIGTTSAQADAFWIDGAQIEQKPYATPYIETNGSTVSRGAASVVAPSSLVTASQGWIALLVQPGVASTSGLVQPIGSWSDGVNNSFSFFLWPGAGFAGRQDGHSIAPFESYSWSAGATTLVIFKWSSVAGSGFFHGSLNGSGFGAAYGGFIVGGATSVTTAGLHLGGAGAGAGGQFDGDVIWAACGTGTLSDTDAAAINAWGSTDPKVASFPSSAQTTMVWNGVSSNGSMK